ncbi:MAG: hypothetical protein ABI444_10590 [Candidatus Kapaibacterium sp.]|jgi:hypothetical protein
MPYIIKSQQTLPERIATPETQGRTPTPAKHDKAFERRNANSASVISVPDSSTEDRSWTNWDDSDLMIKRTEAKDGERHQVRPILQTANHTRTK